MNIFSTPTEGLDTVQEHLERLWSLAADRNATKAEVNDAALDVFVALRGLREAMELAAKKKQAEAIQAQIIQLASQDTGWAREALYLGFAASLDDLDGLDVKDAAECLATLEPGTVEHVDATVSLGLAYIAKAIEDDEKVDGYMARARRAARQQRGVA